MKFDFISDLHVEFNQAWADNPAYDGTSAIYPWHLEKQSDVLIIAGDCGNDPFTTLAVVDEAKQFYEHVIFTDGNHEHYNGRTSADNTVGDNNRLFIRYMREEPKVVFLNGNTQFKYRDTLVIGANGWYNWTAHSWTSREQQKAYWQRDMGDAHCINFDEGEEPDTMASNHADMLREAVAHAQDDDEINDIVVITHTIPHRSGMVPDNHQWGYLNGSFHNPLMEQVWMVDEAKKIKFWGFGHTHFHYDFVDWDIRFVNNSRGYSQERRNDRFGGIMQIDTAEELVSAFELGDGGSE